MYFKLLFPWLIRAAVVAALVFTHHLAYKYGTQKEELICKQQMEQFNAAQRKENDIWQRRLNEAGKQYEQQRQEDQQRYNDLVKQHDRIKTDSPAQCSITPDRVQLVEQARSADQSAGTAP